MMLYGMVAYVTGVGWYSVVWCGSVFFFCSVVYM